MKRFEKYKKYYHDHNTFVLFLTTMFIMIFYVLYHVILKHLSFLHNICTSMIIKYICGLI
jgi:hypothetical protein